MILEVSWEGLWTFSFGAHNFMVTALGSCVKWPLLTIGLGWTSYLLVLQESHQEEFLIAQHKNGFLSPQIWA